MAESVPPRRPDRIAIRGLTAYAHHGVYAFERRQGQTFRATRCSRSTRGRPPRPTTSPRTVNYAELAQRLYAALSSEPVDLLETLAQRLADVCLAYELVDAVEITVHKPEADLGVPFDDVTVTIRREPGHDPRGALARRQPRGPRRSAPRAP